MPFWFEVIAVCIFVLLIAVKRYRPAWWFWQTNLIKLDSEGKGKTVRDVPGPLALPVLGTRWIYSILGSYKLDLIHESYSDLHRRYGVLCKEEGLWNVPVISVFSREYIEAILKRSSRYPLRPPQEVISYYRRTRSDRYTNLGLVNEQGETWHKLRDAFTPELMASNTVLGFFPAMNGVTDDFIDLIRNRRNGLSVKGFEDLSYRLGLESTCTLILGKHLGFLKPEESSQLTSKLAEAVRVHFTAARDAFYGLPLWKLLPTATYKRLIESEDTIYNIISELVDETLIEQQGDARDDDVEAVFKSILRGKNLDMRDKKAAIIDFIAAGIHTLGNTVVFMLHILAKNPEIQQRLYEEVSTLASPRCDIASEDIRNSKYLRAFIQESFRLIPTITCIARILDAPIQLGEYFLDARTVVLLHTWVAGLNEENFFNAGECIPERWINPTNLTPHSPLLVAPFGVGRRICPGKKFVNQALQLILAKLVREFEITTDEELGLQFEFILAPRGPVNINFKDRNEET